MRCADMHSTRARTACINKRTMHTHAPVPARTHPCTHPSLQGLLSIYGGFAGSWIHAHAHIHVTCTYAYPYMIHMHTCTCMQDPLAVYGGFGGRAESQAAADEVLAANVPDPPLPLAGQRSVHMSADGSLVLLIAADGSIWLYTLSPDVWSRTAPTAGVASEAALNSNAVKSIAAVAAAAAMPAAGAPSASLLPPAPVHASASGGGVNAPTVGTASGGTPTVPIAPGCGQFPKPAAKVRSTLPAAEAQICTCVHMHMRACRSAHVYTCICVHAHILYHIHRCA